MKDKNQLILQTKKSLLFIALFLIIGTFLIKATEVKAEVGEEQRMQHLLDTGRIDEDEYDEWLENYEEEREESENFLSDFLSDPFEMVSNAFTSIFDGMANIVKEALADWLKDFLNLVDYKTVTKTALNPERTFDVFNIVYSGLYSVILSLSLSLLILKTLLYSFNVYILWRNGTPDENPFEVIVRHIFAIAMILSFQEIYTIIGNIANEILDRINQVVTPTTGLNTGSLLNLMVGPGWLLTIIFLILFVIEYIKAIITTAGKGIELFIFRIGAPIACISATTPQAGVFNQYVMAIIKSIISIFIMVIALNISVTIMFSSFTLTGFLWATASLKLVNKGSSLLSQFSTSPNQSGGGVGGMLLQAGRMAVTTLATGTPK